MEILKRTADALQQGEHQQVATLVAEALGAGIPAGDVLQQGLLAGMNVVGEQFRLREIFLPDVLMAAKAMYAGLDVLKPHLASEGVPSRGKIVIGTVKGDLHDIGKNLVGIMLKGAGFEVIDLGHDVAPEAFVDTAVREEATLIGMSALLTTTMPSMTGTIKALQEAGLRDQVKVMIGGAPVTDGFAKQIGADGYSPDASSAVRLAKSLVAA